MPETPEARPPEDIAPLLRLGLDEDRETQMADPNATILVTAPTPRTGSSGQSGGGSRGWSPPSVEELQKALPQYEISAFIARGGMGAVYKGTQKTLKRPVAIKVLPPEMGDDTGDLQFAARFKHEAQAMAQLSHPNIVAVFDAGEVVLGQAGQGAARQEGQDGTLLYFVMEFIEGTDVAQLIASEGIVEPKRAIQITTAVCEALAFAHEEGIIHRDIKPSNIMIDKKGRVKVADFGLAKTVSLDATLLTGTNLAMGTPDFIAPEAFVAGMKVDQRADIYAVGVMLYQMLTGTIPRGRFELPSGVVPQMDKGLDAVVDKAMQTDRDKRYSTATEMKVAVERVSQLVPTPVPEVGAGRKSWKTRSARKPLLLAAAVLVMGTSAFLLTRGPQESGLASGTSVASALGTAQETVRTTLSATPEPWANALTLETKLASQPSDLTPEGLRLTGNRMMKQERAPKRDGALRMQTHFVPGTQGPQLRVRNAAYDAQSYSLNIDADGRAAVLRRLAKADGGTGKLGEFPLPKPLSAGEDYELELRAVGSQFTVRFNGQALGEAEDAAIAEGMFGIASASTEPVLVKTLEYLNLDGSTLSQSPPLPVSKSVPPYPPGQWVKVLASVADLPPDARAKNLLTWQPDGWIVRKESGSAPSAFNLLRRTGKNGGIRLRGRVDAALNMDALTSLWVRKQSVARTDANDSYRLGLRAPLPGQVTLNYWMEKERRSVDLHVHTPQPPLADGAEFTLELVAIGTQLHARFNGVALPVITDTRLTTGEVGLHPLHPVRDVEVINLDGLSEAEARKVAGIE
ncbi:MAG TPA: hypothetical protein DDZ88_20570 [Verrucomicrobiales bacterium]|nr:hypothetical protein [Verrucomicrobiales bacterium]